MSDDEPLSSLPLPSPSPPLALLPKAYIRVTVPPSPMANVVVCSHPDTWATGPSSVVTRVSTLYAGSYSPSARAMPSRFEWLSPVAHSEPSALTA